MSDSSGNDVETRTAIASMALAIVALAVSLVALVGTLGQLCQQYLATAVGYSNCGERVMGPWAKYTKLRFRPWELRFEVVFEAPVFFLCQPTNRMGPVKGAPIYFMDGRISDEKFAPGSKEKGILGQYGGASASWLLLFSLILWAKPAQNAQNGKSGVVGWKN
ncbi:modin [Colletotrichum truncatum]|uniref:Modin n=1 Tax=Colletotrichum truncatum TaxID=5467 RepID=A0ACC3Z2C7_COLTU|nr:modin [Colletotrichum truncatum]KAF6786504.1 modin [Colletotrichum truncatum]